MNGRALTLSLLLLAALPAQAEGDPRFDAIRAKAQTLESGLGAFLEGYAGHCVPHDGECEKHVKAFRKQVDGKRFYFIVGDDAPSVLAPGRYDRAEELMELRLTPFFSSGGLALTHGTPRKTNPQGQPLLPILMLQSRLPADYTDGDFARLVTNRGLRLEVVFSPQSTWVLPRKGGAPWRGVQAKLAAVLVTVARTGEAVALWLPD